jgi:hypothetical protein
VVAHKILTPFYPLADNLWLVDVVVVALNVQHLVQPVRRELPVTLVPLARVMPFVLLRVTWGGARRVNEIGRLLSAQPPKTWYLSSLSLKPSETVYPVTSSIGNTVNNVGDTN